MAGTNAVAVKQALVTVLDALPALDGVQVIYSGRVRDLEREAIYFGKARWTNEFSAMRAGARIPRKELLTVAAYVFVATPGGTPEDAEARAQALGAVMENALADDPAGSALGATGVKVVRAASGELDADVDDDGAYALLAYQLAITSILT